MSLLIYKISDDELKTLAENAIKAKANAYCKPMQSSAYLSLYFCSFPPQHLPHDLQSSFISNILQPLQAHTRTSASAPPSSSPQVRTSAAPTSKLPPRPSASAQSAAPSHLTLPDSPTQICP